MMVQIIGAAIVVRNLLSRNSVSRTSNPKKKIGMRRALSYPEKSALNSTSSKKAPLSMIKLPRNKSPNKLI